MVEHAHDEPVTMGLMAKEHLKGAKNINFKYGGGGIEFSEPLYKMGLLSRESVNVKGTDIVPMDLILKLAPPAPKYPDEIQEIIDEGLEVDEGAFLVRVDGEKDGKKTRIDCYVNAPSLVEAFEKSGLTHESYLTGQSAALFTKMFFRSGTICFNGYIKQQNICCDSAYKRPLIFFSVIPFPEFQKKLYLSFFCNTFSHHLKS